MTMIARSIPLGATTMTPTIVAAEVAEGDVTMTVAIEVDEVVGVVATEVEGEEVMTDRETRAGKAEEDMEAQEEVHQVLREGEGEVDNGPDVTMDGDDFSW